MNEYNNTVHSKIKMTATQACVKKWITCLTTYRNKFETTHKQIKTKIKLDVTARTVDKRKIFLKVTKQITAMKYIQLFKLLVTIFPVIGKNIH